jgi:hypothetical protein
MCRCDFSRGIPLNDFVLEQMLNEERIFWESFFEEVQQFIDQNPDTETLPEDLVRKHQFAAKEYGGMKYCQMVQLKERFNIPDQI